MPLVIRDHIETDLADPALQLLVDDAVAEITSRFGDDSTVTRTFRDPGRTLSLRRPALTVTSVNEYDSGNQLLRAVEATDYVLLHGGRSIARLASLGWATSWAPVVMVVYEPVPEQPLRDRLTVDLVKLAVRYTGVQGQTIGDFNEVTYLEYTKTREQLLQGYANRRGAFRF